MSPLTIFVLVFVLLTIGGFVLLRPEIVRDGGFKRWVATFPTTPGRIFVSIALAVFFVVITMLLTVMAAMNTKVTELPNDVLKVVAGFLLIMMGIDLTAYIAKRMTHKPEGSGPLPGATAEQPAAPTSGSTTVRTEGGASVTVVPPTPPAGGV